MPREVEIASLSIDFEAAFDSAAFFIVKVSQNMLKFVIVAHFAVVKETIFWNCSFL